LNYTEAELVVTLTMLVEALEDQFILAYFQLHLTLVTQLEQDLDLTQQQMVETLHLVL
jgi:hypothetical protein